MNITAGTFSGKQPTLKRKKNEHKELLLSSELGDSLFFNSKFKVGVEYKKPVGRV